MSNSYQSRIYESSKSYSYFGENSLVFSDFEVFQLAKANFKKGKQKDFYLNQSPHINYCDELTFVLGGVGKIFSDDKCLEIKQGQMHIVFKSQLHKISSLSAEPVKFYSLAFRVFEGSELFKLYSEVKKYCLENDKYITTNISNVIWSFENVIENFATLPKGNNSYINIAMESTLKYILTMSLLEMLPKVKAKADTLLEQIKVFLTINCNMPNALNLLAKRLNYSYPYLSHFFKDKTSQTLANFLRDIRMKRAKQLLAQGLSVSDVSDTLGYSSIHAFSRAYKSYYAFSPTENR